MTESETTLDPADWTALRQAGHRMLDDAFNHLMSLPEQPVWRPMPEGARRRFHAALPIEGSSIEDVYDIFRQDILPYGGGNTHPAFMGWVQGGGTAVGMLAEMLAAGLNANLGGRDHAPIAVERQVVAWVRDIFGFPASADGLFMTGSSQANFVATLIARMRALGPVSRTAGNSGGRLTAYTSVNAHGCVLRAMEMAGLGTDNLRLISAAPQGRIDLVCLEETINADLASGCRPFLIVGSAGTVNTGSIDDLSGLADVSEKFGVHFHIDGALGALAVLSAELKPLFTGIERGDSLAFDFHKWGQVPYDAGFLLVRDRQWQLDCFASENAYLTRASRGLAGGDWWPCDSGPDLSRGFRALKTWFTLKTYGLQALGESIAANCHLAQSLARLVEAAPVLEVMAPVALNVVCFRYIGAEDCDAANAWIVEALHEAGLSAPSLTIVDGKRAIRAAIVNHRTRQIDMENLVEGVLAFAKHFEQRERQP